MFVCVSSKGTLINLIERVKFIVSPIILLYIFLDSMHVSVIFRIVLVILNI